MEKACDMDKPIGYWVQQTRIGGETIAVKVLDPFTYKQSDGDGGQAGEVSPKPAKTG